MSTRCMMYHDDGVSRSSAPPNLPQYTRLPKKDIEKADSEIDAKGEYREVEIKQVWFLGSNWPEYANS